MRKRDMFISVLSDLSGHSEVAFKSLLVNLVLLCPLCFRQHFHTTIWVSLIGFRSLINKLCQRRSLLSCHYEHKLFMSHDTVSVSFGVHCTNYIA